MNRQTIGVPTIALLLSTIACTNAAPPIGSASPTLTSTSPTPTSTVSRTDPGSFTPPAAAASDEEIGIDDGTWDRASVPGTALALVNGWSGGYLAVTGSSDARGDTNAIHVWSIGANGALDRSFGDDGSVRLTRGRGDASLIVDGVEKRSSDRSLLVLITAGDSDGAGPAFVHRVEDDGRLDATYLDPQGAGFRMLNGYDARMTLIPDGSARICWTAPEDPPSIGMWALRADGSRDPSFGDDGTRTDILGDATSCAGIETDAYGNVVLAAVHHERAASDQGPTKRAVSLVRMTADATIDDTFGPEALSEPDRSFDARLMRIARDGSIVVAGVVTPVHPESVPLGPDRYEPSGPPELFIARADANGRWIRSFGREGVVTLPLDIEGAAVRLHSLDPANQRTFLSVDQPIQGGDQRQASLRAIRTVNGADDPSLDEDGYLRTRFSVVRTIADGRGGFLLFGTPGSGPQPRAVLERSSLTGS